MRRLLITIVIAAIIVASKYRRNPHHRVRRSMGHAILPDTGTRAYVANNSADTVSTFAVL